MGHPRIWAKRSFEGREGTETRRFDIDLLIVHPSMDPAEIGAALKLEGHTMHRAGAPSTTPTGQRIGANWPDTRWRHKRSYQTSSQHFADELAEMIGYLEPSRDFLGHVHATGGRTQIMVQFLGDGYFGETIPCELLTVAAALGLDLGLEVFVVPQSEPF